jgi:hypothetical protein
VSGLRRQKPPFLFLGVRGIALRLWRELRVATSAAEAVEINAARIAALKRCATQKPRLQGLGSRLMKTNTRSIRIRASL